MRLLRATGVLAGILLLLAGAAGAGAQEQAGLTIEAIDARDFPTVGVLLTPPPAFYGVVPTATVVENGVALPGTVRLLAQEPLRVVLAVDTSGSMAGEPLAAAKEAAKGFVTQLPPTTLVAVLSFAAQPEVTSDFSEDPQVSLDAIDALRAGGETALYDAVAAAWEALNTTEPGRRFIVLLSDGGDTVSTTTLDEAKALLAQGGVGFYAVELQTEESDHAALEALAAGTAGRVVPAEDPAALAAVYDQIASELANQVLVTYTSPGGGPTTLTVTISYEGASVSATAEITLPGGTTTTTSTTTTTQPPTTTTSQPPTTTLTTLPPPPPSYQSTGPGLFGRPWLLPVGAAAIGLAALIALAMALLPGGRQHASTLAGAARGAGTAAAGPLSRFADRAKMAAESALIRGGRRSKLTAGLDSAGVRLAAGEFVVLTLCAGVVGLALGALLWRLPGALLLGAVGLLVPRVILLNIQQKRRAAFAEQLDGTLQLLAGSLRAGYGLLQSLNTAAQEAPSPTKEELNRIMVETRLGRDLVDSLTALAARMDSQDFRWVAQAIDIQRSVGGDLAEILDTVSQTIRERNQIRRQIKALSAEGRVSAYILIAIPIVIAGLIMLVNPGFLTPLVETAAGKIASVAGGILMIIGIIWIRRLVRLRF